MLFSSLILLYLLLLVWPFIAAQADHDFRFERHLRVFWIHGLNYCEEDAYRIPCTKKLGV